MRNEPSEDKQLTVTLAKEQTTVQKGGWENTMRHGRKREHRLGFAVCVYYGTPGGCQHWKRMAGVYRGSRWIYEDCIDDDIDDDDVDSDETLYPLCK